ncbi:hypothetical protein CC86DRAFT_340176 [Ophiobolus disseminans]|uniref:SMODS and SLOG-associating 2TM effector domain-containing protein n=1 Tax=Ophiobolus disseminans TaxID=1469910 RepID=A0A6A7AFW3_9PLEO|nr:hypothetical protein CC86DRAFT_340176 [Ophiobolus disseminans]
MPYSDEETPLLRPSRSSPYDSQDGRSNTHDIHQQFCSLAGVPPSNLPQNARHPAIARRSLYGRAVHRRNAQNRTYLITASLSNTLLLSQVVLGAALTGLGASGSSHILITVFGALNTIIAGVVAYLKSRGQPMRARMYRDDLDRVVDEIENSEVMWLGIQSGVHGYDEIAIDDNISVRSEVARLTRLYDKVVKNNTMNDPDMYINAVTDGSNAALRARPGEPLPAPTVNDAPAAAPTTSAPDPSAPIGVVVPPVATPDDPDTAPASAPPRPKTPPPHEDPAQDSKPEPTDESSKPKEGSSAPQTNGVPINGNGKAGGGGPGIVI